MPEAGKKGGAGPQEENRTLKEEVKTLTEELNTTKKGEERGEELNSHERPSCVCEALLAVWSLKLHPHVQEEEQQVKPLLD